MNTRLSAIVVVSFLMTACGGLEKKSILVNNGDTKQQVIEAMGTPDDRQLNGDAEVWQYCQTGLASDITTIE